MTKREYLRSLGFTVGERGRFNEVMKIELAKYDGVFDDDIKPLKLNKLKEYPATKKQVAQVKAREARQLFGYTKEGYKVGFITCAACHEHMTWCQCDKILAPSVVNRSDDSLVIVRGK
jgi:hypothetical protein